MDEELVNLVQCIWVTANNKYISCRNKQLSKKYLNYGFVWIYI